MSRYLGTVRMTADDSLDIDGLRTVYRASIGWTNEVGSDRAPDMRRGLQDFNLCHELGQRIIAASRVWWRWTESGKAWWIEMTFSNRTDFHLWASLGGTAYGTHLLSSETDQPGSSQFLSWGGSSADITKINPGSGRQLIAPGADVDVHTSSDGTLEIREAYVFVHLPRRITHRYPLDCMIPISQG